MVAEVVILRGDTYLVVANLGGYDFGDDHRMIVRMIIVPIRKDNISRLDKVAIEWPGVTVTAFSHIREVNTAPLLTVVLGVADHLTCAGPGAAMVWSVEEPTVRPRTHCITVKILALVVHRGGIVAEGKPGHDGLAHEIDTVPAGEVVVGEWGRPTIVPGIFFGICHSPAWIIDGICPSYCLPYLPDLVFHLLRLASADECERQRSKDHHPLCSICPFHTPPLSG